MRTVWKYTIEQLGTPFLLEMPERACPLTVQLQDGVPRLWATVETDDPHVQREFVVVKTDQPLELLNTVYVGTFQMRCVWHLFEILEALA